LSDNNFFLEKLFKQNNQLERLKLLRNNPADISENLFWLLHFYTLVFLLKGKWPQALEIMEMVIEVNALLNDATINDHSKYLQVACYTLLEENKRAEQILTERIQIHRILKEWTQTGELFLQLGKLYRKYKPEKTLDILKEASKYLLKSKKWKELTYCMLNIGEIHLFENNLEKSLENFNDAYKYSKKAGINTLIVQSLNWQGFINEILEKKEMAAVKFQEACNLSEKVYPDLICSLANRGRICKKMGYYKEAFVLYNETIDLKREIDFKHALGQNLYYRGLTLMHTGLLEKAYKCFYEALTVCKQIGNWQWELCLLHSINILRWKMNKNFNAISFFPDKDKQGGERFLSQTESDILESHSFKPLLLKYTDKGHTEYYAPPYIGKIQFNRGIIFEFSEDRSTRKKLVEVLENFLGKTTEKENINNIMGEPLINRKVLREDLIAFARLFLRVGNFEKALDLLEEILTINFFLKDDRQAEEVLQPVKEIYEKRGYYERGIDFFEKIAKKANLRRMVRTEALCYGLQGNLLAKTRYFSEAMFALRKSLALRKKIGERKALIRTLVELACFHRDQGGYPIGENYFKEALEECEKGEIYYEKLEILKALGNLYGRQKRFGKAIKIYQEIAEISRLLYDGEEQLSLFLLAGNACNYLGKPRMGLKIYIWALIKSYKDGAIKWLITILESAGKVYEDLGLYKKALSCYKFRLKLSEREAILPEIASSLSYMGHQEFLAGNIKRAEDFIEKSLKINKRINNKINIWISLIYMGRIKHEEGKIEDAYTLFMESYKIITEYFSLELLEASSNFHLAVNFYIKGKINQSLFYLREALKIYREELTREHFSFFPRQKISIYTCLALINLLLGKLEEAEKCSSMALELYKKMEILPGEAEILAIAGEIQQRMGNFLPAEKYFKKSLSIYRKAGDLSGRLRTLSALGKLHLDREKYGGAKSIFQKILKEKSIYEMMHSLAETTFNLALSLYYLNHVESSMEKTDGAISLFETLKQPVGLIKAYKLQGEIQITKENFQEGQKNFSKALDLSNSCGLLNYQSILLFLMAQIKKEEKDYNSSFEFLVQSKEISKKICRPDMSWKINFELGTLALLQKRHRQVIKFFMAAIQEIESYPWLPLLDMVGKDSGKIISNGYKGINIYRGLIEYFLKVGENEEALNMLERAKAFLITKKLQENREREILFRRDRQSIKEDEVRDNIKNLYYRLVNQGEMETELMPEIWGTYLKKKEEYLRIIEKTLKKSPEKKSNYHMIYLSFKEIKALLPEGSSFIEYYFTNKNMLIFWLYASPENFFTLKISQISLPSEELRKNLPGELSEENLSKLLKHIKGKIPDLEFSKEIYYIIQDRLLVWKEEVFSF